MTHNKMVQLCALRTLGTEESGGKKLKRKDCKEKEEVGYCSSVYSI
jgi:hypothetical protein